MKVYSFGKKSSPALLLLPGTCCHWKGNFGRVLPLLEKQFHVLCVSYDGFDETEDTEFEDMISETRKIEEYIEIHCGGHIRCAYGCSLGGSFVGLLVARKNIHIDCAILGSSDLDQASPVTARMETAILIPLIYPLIRNGSFRNGFMQKKLEKGVRKMGEYGQRFMDILGGAHPYVTKESCQNQFYSDLITPLPERIDISDTEIHIFYAEKMGEKYLKRYQKHFAHPIIHRMNLEHEELLACYPEKWAELVCSIALKEEPCEF